MITKRFDSAKALEVLVYVASKVEYMYHTQKIIYFANRYHLERYGRFILDDRIIAMKNGPVLSNVYDMVKCVRGSNFYIDCPEAREALVYLNERPNLDQLVPKRDPDMDYLSDSDIECLDEATAKFKNMSFSNLEAYSHDDLYKTADLNDEITVENVINHSKDAELLRKYLAG